MLIDPLDEYPIHQVPMSMAYVATSDRNVYDRCIFQGQDHQAEAYFLTGLGVYPNAGIIDAFISVRTGDIQKSLQVSGIRPGDRMAQTVGPYRIEVVEPLRQLRVICDDAELGVDLTYRADLEVLREPQHIKYSAPTGKVSLEGCRFAQIGTWEGQIHLDGRTIDVTPDRWTATRDRSWGIRPVGDADPAGRPSGEDPHVWWVWIPLSFEDFGVHVMVDSEPDGFRTVNYAVRCWPSSTGRKIEQLGWPEIDIRYRSGSRVPEGATLHLRTVDRKSLEIDIDCLTAIALHLGCGYGSDPEWNHGRWMGDSWRRVVTFDYSDPDVQARLPWGGIDHLARATCDGRTGYGIFEHGTVGRHDPTGMADLTSVAP
ncbi:MAG TPA: hypothetical protein VG435_03615 [Acidimicrobiales bacterium]|jgi:hypothetical protein|nr:hypothetical protein [Acidimicrobiales bacterium]